MDFLKREFAFIDLATQKQQHYYIIIIIIIYSHSLRLRSEELFLQGFTYAPKNLHILSINGRQA
jgi:hypothetical protein